MDSRANQSTCQATQRVHSVCQGPVSQTLVECVVDVSRFEGGAKPTLKDVGAMWRSTAAAEKAVCTSLLVVQLYNLESLVSTVLTVVVEVPDQGKC